MSKTGRNEEGRGRISTPMAASAESADVKRVPIDEDHGDGIIILPDRRKKKTSLKVTSLSLSLILFFVLSVSSSRCVVRTFFDDCIEIKQIFFCFSFSLCC